MKIIEIICDTCGNKSQKRKAEIDRRKKQGKNKFYCDYSCASRAKGRSDHLKNMTDRYNIAKHSSNRKDDLSPFRWHIRRIKNRKHKHSCDVDAIYLKELWESQKGICPLTGWKLQPRIHTTDHNTSIYSASIDRIDSDKGYIKGNIRFIAVIANYARNNFTDEDVIEFCKSVAKKHK